jgi:WD40 repeat protein
MLSRMKAGIDARTVWRSLAAVLFLALEPAGATPINGLTVALSPDGQTLVASGSNRAFLRLDPANLEVLERVWHGLSITTMAFNHDGSVLAVTDAGTGGLVTFFDARTLQRKFDIRGREAVAFCTPADLFAGVEAHRSAEPFLAVQRLGDGGMVLRAALLPRRPVAAVGLDPEGRTAAVLYEAQNDPAEDKSTPEAGLQGLDRIVAMHQGDGRTSVVDFYDIGTGELTARHTLFYAPGSSARAVLLAGDLIVVCGNNQNARIGPDGSVRLFQTACSVNYGIGFTPDHRTILTGGLAQAALTSAEDLATRGFPVQQKLPSWPEYFRGFAGRPEGPFFGATDGFRVFSIHPQGSVAAVQPAY